MKDEILIHTHFHKRKTGVTVSIENVLPHLSSRIRTYIYGYGIEGNKISFRELIKKLRQNPKSIIHAHRNNEILFFLILKLLRFRFFLVYTRHSETKPSSLTTFLMRKADQLISLTPSMNQNLSIPSIVIGHGVDIDIFKPSDVLLENIRQPKLIVCVGRIRKAKGQKTLLEAAAPLLFEHNDWAIAFLGKVDKEDYKQMLNEIVSKNGIAEQVYFLGEVSDIVKYYQYAKAAVIASHTEGFSLTCVEAMASGCTTFATKDVGIHSKLIDDKNNGYLFDVGNSDSLSKLLGLLFKGEIPYLGQKARLEVERNWSAQNEADQLLEVYRSR
ncbi:MAG: glycosyltransferase family 4 protein [Bacteroidota bacterium]